MRLWHKDLIPYLPRQQLLGQWRECCSIAKQIAVEGRTNHILINKVMKYPPVDLDTYADEIYHEMKKRGYRPNRGSYFDWRNETETKVLRSIFSSWHNGTYLEICMANLFEKYLCNGMSYEEWKKLADGYYKLTGKNYFI